MQAASSSSSRREAAVITLGASDSEAGPEGEQLLLAEYGSATKVAVEIFRAYKLGEPVFDVGGAEAAPEDEFEAETETLCDAQAQVEAEVPVELEAETETGAEAEEKHYMRK